MFGVIEVAQRYGVSRDTVLSWIHAGLLPAVDVSPAESKRNFWRITQEGLDMFERERNTRRHMIPALSTPMKRYV